MKSITYMWRKTIRNHIRQVLRKPALLIVYLLIAGLLIFTFSVSSLREGGVTQDAITGYAAILLGAFLFIGGMSVWNGLKQGTSLFSMADVNFLFTAPVNPRKILLSGIVRQAGVMLMASVLMLFQYPNMRNNGLDGYALFGLIFSYFLMGVSTNLLAAVIYAFCAGHPAKRKRVYDGMLMLVALLIVGAAAYAYFSGGSLMGGFASVFGASSWDYVPIFGWARGLAIALALREWLRAGMFTALMLAGAGLCALLLQRTDMDYFEDVLLSAERANQKAEDAKAGRIVDQGEVSARVKREKGALYGMGALAFTGRMLREQSRKGILLFDTSTITALMGPVMGLIFMSGEVTGQIGFWGVIGMTLWLQLFLSLQSGSNRELTYPYIYLAPRPAFYKLLAMLAPGILKSMLDGLVFAAALMVLYKGAILECIAGFIIYISIMLLYAAGALVVERILGASRNRVLIMLVYIIMLLLLCVPGIVLANIIAPTPLISYLLFAAWNILVALVVIFLCRNILHSLDAA